MRQKERNEKGTEVEIRSAEQLIAQIIKEHKRALQALKKMQALYKNAARKPMQRVDLLTGLLREYNVIADASLLEAQLMARLPKILSGEDEIPAPAETERGYA